jgi:hypothetical protein
VHTTVPLILTLRKKKRRWKEQRKSRWPRKRSIAFNTMGGGIDNVECCPRSAIHRVKLLLSQRAMAVFLCICLCSETGPARCAENLISGMTNRLYHMPNPFLVGFARTLLPCVSTHPEPLGSQEFLPDLVVPRLSCDLLKTVFFKFSIYNLVCFDIFYADRARTTHVVPDGL